MKKLVLCAAVAVFSFAKSHAQLDTSYESTETPEVQLGVKGGVNFATVTGDDYDSPDSRTTFNLGLLAEIPFSQRFSIQPEVYYSGQGFNIDSGNTANPFENDGKLEYKLDYIQVPVLAKVYLIEGLSVQAGPQIGFKVNENVDFNPSDDNNNNDVEIDKAKDIDFSVAAGLEYKFNNGFFIQGRYNYGVTELIKDQDVHNSVFQAGIGFMY